MILRLLQRSEQPERLMEFFNNMFYVRQRARELSERERARADDDETVTEDNSTTDTESDNEGDIPHVWRPLVFQQDMGQFDHPFFHDRFYWDDHLYIGSNRQGRNQIEAQVDRLLNYRHRGLHRPARVAVTNRLRERQWNFTWHNVYFRPSLFEHNMVRFLILLHRLVYHINQSMINVNNSRGINLQNNSSVLIVVRTNSGQWQTFNPPYSSFNSSAFTFQDWNSHSREFYNSLFLWLADEDYNDSESLDFWYDKFSVQVLRQVHVRGVGGMTKRSLSTSNNASSKRSKYSARLIQKFRTVDNSCLLQSVILGILYQTQPMCARFLNHKNTEIEGSERHRQMHQFVKSIYDATGIIPGTLCGLPEAKLIAEHFSERLRIPVCIFCYDESLNFVWRTTSIFDEKTLFVDVLWSRSHFTCVDKIHLRLKGQENYCRKCCTTYKSTPHRCRDTPQRRAQDISCGMCGKTSTDHYSEWVTRGKQTEEWIRCKDCGRNFAGEECFSHHQTEEYLHKRTMCQSKWKCVDCGKKFKIPTTSKYKMGGAFCRREDHDCKLSKCTGCEEMVEKDSHVCYLQPYTPPEQNLAVYYYDIESRVDPDDPEQNHIPVCIVIMNEKSESIDESFVFYDEWKAIEFFLEHPGIYVAHNGGNYDTHILLRLFVRYKEQLSYKFVSGAGTRLFEIWVKKGSKHIKKDKATIFKDSLCFVPAALKNFTKMFGIPAVKGHFPFTLLNELGVDYKGPKPPLKAFIHHRLSSKEKKELTEWYDKLPEEYDLKKQMTYYCQMDVLALLQGINKFREIFVQYGGIDPVKTSSTIAGSVWRVFRHKFMKPASIQQIKTSVSEYYRTFLAGGRTEVFIPWADGVPMQYADVTSEYPYINSFGWYPEGKMVEHNFGENGVAYEDLPSFLSLQFLPNDRVSFMVIDITCPQDLHIPLLQDCGQTRLLFTLRDKHKMGYTSMELKKALSLGYTITRVYKVCTWDSATQGFGGSREFMMTFYKLKLLASGLPPKNTLEQNLEYCANIKEMYGIDVKPEEFEHNPGLRTVSKLQINSLWGKAVQRLASEFSNTHIFGSGNLDDYERVRTRATRCIPLPHDQVMIMCKNEKEKPEDIVRNTNPFVGLFTTAQARLHLYKGMEAVGLERVVYCDTDSLVYIQYPHQARIPENDALGGWVSEIETGFEIRKWSASGPKAYSAMIYNQTDGKFKECILKVKGHSLKAEEAAHITYKTIEDAVLKGVSTHVDYRVIQRPRTGEISRVHTAIRRKTFGPTPQKRYVLPLKDGEKIIKTRAYTNEDNLPF